MSRLEPYLKIGLYHEQNDLRQINALTFPAFSAEIYKIVI